MQATKRQENPYKKLVTRLCTLPGQDVSMFGISGEMAQQTRDEIGAALAKCASIEHAKRVVDRIMERLKFRPTPAEIAAEIAQTPATVEAPRPQWDCPECHGTGFRLASKHEPDCRCGGTSKLQFRDSQGAYEAKCMSGITAAEKCGCVGVPVEATHV